MLLGDREFTFDRVFRIGAGIAILWGLVWLLGYLSSVLIPFAVAFLLAYLLDPVVTRVQRLIPHRLVAVLTTLLCLLLALALALVIFVPIIYAEIAHTSQIVGKLAADANLAEQLDKQIPDQVWERLEGDQAVAELQSFLRQERVVGMLQSAAQNVLPRVWNLVSGTASVALGAIGVFVVLLYLVFLLMDFEKLKRRWRNMIPPDYRRPVLEFLHDFDDGMSRYFRNQAVIASLVGIGFAVGFHLIDLPMGILLGLFVGLLNMVPYLQIIGLVPAFVLAVIDALGKGDSILLAMLWVFVVFAVVQGIQDAVLTPRIMGRATGLSPAMILLSLSVWGKLLGFLGLIIALPMTCLLRAYYHRIVLHTEYDGEPEPLVDGTEPRVSERPGRRDPTEDERPAPPPEQPGHA